MTSHLPVDDMSMFNTVQDVFTADSSPSSSTAITADTPKSSVTKTSVRKAGKTEVKPPTGGTGRTARRSWKKPKDKPKRPLSAYNLFFQSEREKLVGVPSDAATTPTNGNTKRRRREAHGKIGFAELAKKISAKWKNLDASSRTAFEARADVERERYRKEVEEWKRGKEEKEALQQQASMLQERARLMAERQQHLQEELLAAANPIDTNAMMANFLARSAANMRMSQQLRAATVIPDGAAFVNPMAASATRALRAIPPPPPTNIGQRTIPIGNASFQHSDDDDDEFSCIAPISVDESDNAELDFDRSLQNDLSQLDALDAMLDNFNTRQEEVANDSFDLGEDDILPLQPQDRTSLQQMMKSASSSSTNATDPLSLSSLIDDCLDSSNEVDRELSAYLKGGLTSSSNFSLDDMLGLENNSNNNLSSMSQTWRH